MTGLAERIAARRQSSGGRNFGCVSSREQAPRIVKQLKMRALVAPSFARIFLPNALNIGLLPLVCDTDGMEEGDQRDFDENAWRLRAAASGRVWTPAPLPDDVLGIVRAGGLVEYVTQRGGL